MKKHIEKIGRNLKKIFNKRQNRIILIIILGVLILIGIILKFTFANDGKFSLNSIYKVFPEEVQELYSNVVEVSCYGDLKFNVELDGDEKKVADIDKNNLLDYLFSHLEKQGLLDDGMEKETIEATANELFSGDLNLLDAIDNYGYGDYTYNVEDGVVTRKERECSSDIKNVLHLYGYSYNKDELSVDINVAYLKDGILYNTAGVELGEYDGDASKLFKLTQNTTYYRLNYVKQKGKFKLSGVEWKNRG